MEAGVPSEGSGLVEVVVYGEDGDLVEVVVCGEDDGGDGDQGVVPYEVDGLAMVYGEVETRMVPHEEEGGTVG